jgi:hypothetical protein
MGHLRHIVLVAVAVLLWVAPGAAGQESQGTSAGGLGPADTVAGLTGGELLRDSWAQLLSVPLAENPFNGNCQPLAHGRAPTPIAFGLDPSIPTSCTVKAGTSVFLRFGTACTDVESPRYLDEAAQIECARGFNRHITTIYVAFDNSQPVDIRRPEFEIVSPQGTVALPAHNILGVPPQTATFTAVAWGALLTGLDRGSHITTFEVVGTGFDVTYTTFIIVV